MDPSAPNQPSSDRASSGASTPQPPFIPMPGQSVSPGTQFSDPTVLAYDAASAAAPPPAAPQPAPVMPTPAATPPPVSRPSPVTGTMPSGNPPETKAKPHPNSTQNSLQIAEIRDGIVIMNDGSFRAVIMAKSINFDLMSPQEQEAVEYSYQGFLNSLFFPIQIFLRSQKVDLRPYIERLDKIRSEHDNMLLALLMEDYIGYIGNLSEQTNIMDKKFYVVIPFFPVADTQKAIDQSKNFLTGLGGVFKPKEQHVTINEADLENAKTELRNRTQAVLAGLLQCSVQGLPLDTQELIELYYDTYNPDTATRQQLKDFNSLTADVVTKGVGNAPQDHLKRELE
ncbi:MAG TPA: hypothetical protein VK534_00805 [Methylomirabilota bacterium]|nr:hypothetical protein [Methylomirabilota bacterium]